MRITNDIEARRFPLSSSQQEIQRQFRNVNCILAYLPVARHHFHAESTCAILLGLKLCCSSLSQQFTNCKLAWDRMRITTSSNSYRKLLTYIRRFSRFTVRWLSPSHFQWRFRVNAQRVIVPLELGRRAAYATAQRVIASESRFHELHYAKRDCVYLTR